MMRKTVMATACLSAMLFVGTTTASADPFAMHSVMKNFCCTDWTDKDGGAPNPGGGLFQAGRELDQQATVNRQVEQTLTSPPFALSLPAGIISQMQTILLPDHPAPSFKTLSQVADLGNQAATFMAGGGPGVFTFCPPNIGPGPGACTAPISAPSPYHGLIRVSAAGINQYGGAMGMMGFVRGFIYQCSGPSGLADCDTEATVFTNNNYSVPVAVIGNATTSLGIMARETGTLTDTIYSTPNWPTAATPMIISVVNGAGAATGHAWTTGMVTVSATQFIAPPFQAVTLTGTDNRVTTGPGVGSGTLTLVGATLYQNLQNGTPTVRGTSVFMQLPEPATGISMAAGVLGLALVGFSRKRA